MSDPACASPHLRRLISEPRSCCALRSMRPGRERACTRRRPSCPAIEQPHDRTMSIRARASDPESRCSGEASVSARAELTPAPDECRPCRCAGPCLGRRSACQSSASRGARGSCRAALVPITGLSSSAAAERSAGSWDEPSRLTRGSVPRPVVPPPRAGRQVSGGGRGYSTESACSTAFSDRRTSTGGDPAATAQLIENEPWASAPAGR